MAKTNKALDGALKTIKNLETGRIIGLDEGMNDVELSALVVLARQETINMEGENALREIQGYSPAYAGDGWGVYSRILHEELERRGKLSGLELH